MRHDFKIGDKVLCNGYEGRITRVCEWSDCLVEVRLDSGSVCVDATDIRTIVHFPE